MLSFLTRNFKPRRLQYLYTSSRRYLAKSCAALDVSKNADDCLVIKWNDGKLDEFPYVYLRENCRCPACYTDERKSRTMFSPKQIDINITAESAEWNNDDDQLQVNWDDGHTSHYSAEWLKYLRYRPPVEGQPPGVLRKGIKLWGSEMSEEEKLPTFQFDSLLNDEEQLYKWLVELVTKTGIARIQNAPQKTGALTLLGNKVGYLVSTTYGVTLQVIAQHSNPLRHEIAYSESAMPMHSDFSFDQVSPAVAMLHCVEQTKGEGGDNLWVDGFHAANLLYEEDPELFQVLVNTPVKLRNYTSVDLQGTLHSESCNPLISVDHANKIKQFRYGDEFRDNHMSTEPKLMKSFYKAYFRCSELLSDRKTSFWYKMEPGDIMTLNNHRVLHARSEFKDLSDNVRRLELGYFDCDCLHSKIRVLAEKQGLQSPLD